MKKLYARLIYKYIIRRIKKGAIKSEFSARLLTHLTMKTLIEAERDEITLTYRNNNPKVKLEIHSKLIEGGEK